MAHCDPVILAIQRNLLCKSVKKEIERGRAEKCEKKMFFVREICSHMQEYCLIYREILKLKLKRHQL